MEKKIKIAGVATKAQGIKWFMLDNLRYAAKNGFESYIICELSDMFDGENLAGITYLPQKMSRGNVSPLEVIKSVRMLYKVFKKEKFDIVQYTSSNAALYGSIASWLARVPVRIYCQWGISYTDYTGIKKWFYKTMVKATCLFSTRVQPDSFSNLEFAIAENLYSRKKGNVIFHGSACGVDLNKFNISKKEKWSKEMRNEYDIPHNDRVIGFVGRIVPEKGINELLEAFMSLDSDHVSLFIVGPYYETEKLNQEIFKKAKEHPKIHFTGPVSNPAKSYAAFDFFVFPSYREGFGSVALEAAAFGVPTIVSNIKEPTEFIHHGENGIVCEVKSTDSLRGAMKNALSMNTGEYAILSRNCYNKVKSEFDSQLYQCEFVKDRLKLYKESQK